MGNFFSKQGPIDNVAPAPPPASPAPESPINGKQTGGSKKKRILKKPSKKRRGKTMKRNQ